MASFWNWRQFVTVLTPELVHGARMSFLVKPA